jgi:hypothetical protein
VALRLTVASRVAWLPCSLGMRRPPSTSRHFQPATEKPPSCISRSASTSRFPARRNRVFRCKRHRAILSSAWRACAWSLPNFSTAALQCFEVAAVQKLSNAQYEDDEPAVTTLSDGSVTAAWVAYQNQTDRVLLRTLRNNVWTEAEEVTPKPADIFRCSVVAGTGGGLWAFWSQRENDRWQIWGREKRDGKWQPAEPIAQTGSNTFHRSAASPSGQIAVVWQSYRNGQSDIYLKVRSSEGSWSQEVRLSDSLANEWEPSVAVGSDGAVYAAGTPTRPATTICNSAAGAMGSFRRCKA